jgi:Mg2+-importing ATPase
VLTVLAAVSWLGTDARATTVIAVMVALNTLIRFVQEGRSHRAAESLKALVSNTATVIRRDNGSAGTREVNATLASKRLEVPIRKLVPGDLVALSAGDMIPAACRVLAANDLFVAEGAMTVVNSVSWLLIRFALVTVPIVLVINGYTKGDWTQAVLFALSVAVGLTPEMLPRIVTTTLAKGAVLLSRKMVSVKRLDAIQNLGAMDILCNDKTGTLTQDKIAVARKDDVFGHPSAEC